MAKSCPQCGAPLSDAAAFAPAAKKNEELGADVPLSAVNARQSVFGVLGGGIGSVVSAVKNAFRSPKKLIPAFLLGAVWLLVTLLPAVGFNPLPVRVLAWLTFAEAGTANSLWRILGGIVATVGAYTLVFGDPLSLAGFLAEKTFDALFDLVRKLLPERQQRLFDGDCAEYIREKKV